VADLRHHRGAADAFFHRAGHPAFAADLAAAVVAVATRHSFAATARAAVAARTAGRNRLGVGFPATARHIHHAGRGDGLHDGVTRIFVARLGLGAVLRDALVTVAGFVNRLAHVVAHIAVAGLVNRRADVVADVAIAGLVARLADLVAHGAVARLVAGSADGVAHVTIAGLIARLADVAGHRAVARFHDRTANRLLNTAILGFVDRLADGVVDVAIAGFLNRLANGITLIAVAGVIHVFVTGYRHLFANFVVHGFRAVDCLFFPDSFADGFVTRHFTGFGFAVVTAGGTGF